MSSELEEILAQIDQRLALGANSMGLLEDVVQLLTEIRDKLDSIDTRLMWVETKLD